MRRAVAEEMIRLLWILVLALAAGAAALPGAAPAAAQEAAREESRAASPSAASEGPGAGATSQEESLVDAPFQFRVGPTLGTLSWHEPAGDGVQRMDDATMWGLDVASVAGRYAGFRLGGSVGPSRIASSGSEFDATQYLVDVVVEGRLAIGPLYEAEVIPFVTVGGGAVVHDPAPDSLITRSQSAFTWGAGLETRVLDRVGARAEWRRVQAEIQDAADPVDRSGTTRFADRWTLGVYWVF